MIGRQNAKMIRKSGEGNAPLEQIKGAGIAPSGRRERRAVETRMRIFRSALALIAERGLPNVTVEDITESADVGKGTFFNYFATKDQVLGVMAEIQIGKISAAAAKGSDGRLAIHGILRRLTQQLAEEPGRSPAMARAIISSFLGSESVREILKRNMLIGRKKIGELVSAGQQRGEINPRLKKEKIAMQFLQAIMGTVLIWSLHETPSLSTLIDDSFQHFWRSVAVSGGEQES
jgi:AcrR family transcriptional regulator